MVLIPDEKGWVKRQNKAIDLYKQFREKGLDNALAIAKVADRMCYTPRGISKIIKKAKENGTITD